MYKYHCLNPISEVGLAQLDENYVVTGNADEADAILVRSAKMHDMEFSRNLKAIARAGAGVNNIPLERCADEGIVVFNTPGANANGVKELVIAALLLGSRDIVDGVAWCRENAADPNIAKTVEKSKKAFAGHEIKGKKLGVIGLGAIGAEVANAAAALGMDVYGYDPFISVNGAWMLSRDVKHIMSVDTIYQECDYITVHVPLMDSTKKMINKDTIASMKDGVVVLNFSRDLLVDDDAMAEALESGKVHRYITDFPNPKSVNMKNVIAIPHLGASTEESEDNCAVMAVKEMMDYLENGNIRNSVNYPSCDMGVCTQAGRISVFHKNVANMITRFAAVFGEKGINISDMINKSKGEVAYTMFDVEEQASEEIINMLRAIPGVFRVRVVK